MPPVKIIVESLCHFALWISNTISFIVLYILNHILQLRPKLSHLAHKLPQALLPKKCRIANSKTKTNMKPPRQKKFEKKDQGVHILVHCTVVPRSHKCTTQNYYRELDFCADVFFTDYYTAHKVPHTERFKSLLRGDQLPRLLSHMTLPHMYVAWRDVLSRQTLEILLDHAEKAHHLNNDLYFLAGVACIKCRLCLESNYNDKAIKYCEEAESYLLSLENGWQKAVIYYTAILTLLRKSQLYRNNRREFLYECIDVFRKCIDCLITDLDCNLSMRYYRLAMFMIVICIKIDLFVHSSKLSHWKTRTSALFISKQEEINAMLKEANAMHQDLRRQQAVILQNKSKFWPETLQNMRHCIEKCERLMLVVPKTNMECNRLKECATQYIQVMIKTQGHYLYEHNLDGGGGGTLFGGISKGLSLEVVSAKTWIPADLDNSPAATGSDATTSNWDHFSGTSSGHSHWSGGDDGL